MFRKRLFAVQVKRAVFEQRFYGVATNCLIGGDWVDGS